jgi:hypothetical protein
LLNYFLKKFHPDRRYFLAFLFFLSFDAIFLQYD